MLKYIFFFVLVPILFFGQAPTIQWDKTIGGSNEDSCMKLIQTNDGGFISIGNSNSNVSFDKSENAKGLLDIWVVKTNNLGNIEWQKTYGGSSDDFAGNIIETREGGYLITAFVNSPISGDNTCGSPFGIGSNLQYTWLIKLDSYGNLIWQKAKDFWPVDIIQLQGGNYIAAGATVSSPPTLSYEDYHIAKLDSQGNSIWDKTIAGDLSDYYGNMILANDGGYIIVGWSLSSISFDKTENQHGQPDQWGGYNGDIWVVKISDSGQIVWQNSIGGDGGDGADKIKYNQNNTYTLIGGSNSPISGDKTIPVITNYDAWIVDIDNLGNVVGQNVFDIDTNARAITTFDREDDGNFLICGSKNWLTTNSEIFVDKLSPTGNLIWEKSINANATDRINNITKTNDGGYILGCYSNSSISGDKTEDSRNNSLDYWLVKLSPDNLTTTNFAIEKANIYPNPTSGLLNINFGQVIEQVNLKLTNVLGQLVSSKTINNLENTTYDIKEPNGIYFLEIESQNKGNKTFKIIKN